MFRRLAPALLALLLVVGCAGPARLTQRSEEKLAVGESWRAWQLATRALDRQPGNARARAAATAAGNSIARDWERRIGSLAEVDSLQAAEQVLAFAAFRAGAARYASIAVSANWSRDEQTLRRGAARVHYQRGAASFASRRPKQAYLHFTEVERFLPDYRDAARLADRAYQKALTRVALVPFRSSTASAANAALGRDVAAAWRDDLDRRMAPPTSRFTRMLDQSAVEQHMSVAQLGNVSREEAVRLGRRAGAERVVWGSIGGVNAETHVSFFMDTIARRVVQKDSDGRDVAHWIDVPIDVVARVRTVTVGADYEVISTASGATLARGHDERSTSARVVWTSYLPEGDLGAYALVSEAARAADPKRAEQVETRWKSVCGEKTALRQVLEARRSTRASARYQRGMLPRFIAGAAFVFLEDLPPPEDLAFAALARGWEPLQQDLVRLDQTDDVDLGMTTSGADER